MIKREPTITAESVSDRRIGVHDRSRKRQFGMLGVTHRRQLFRQDSGPERARHHSHRIPASSILRLELSAKVESIAVVIAHIVFESEAHFSDLVVRLPRLGGGLIREPIVSSGQPTWKSMTCTDLAIC